MRRQMPKQIEQTIVQTPDALAKSLGYDRVSYNNIQDLQIDFLETMRALWPFTLRFHYAEETDNFDEMARIKEEQQPVLLRAKGIIHLIAWIRLNIVEACEKDETTRREMDSRCRDSWKFFINYFCWMEDPRIIAPLPRKIPFIMYPAQERVLETMEGWLDRQQNGIVFKSRGAGISWGFCALEVHHWKYLPGYRSILGSETEEKVDIIGSSDPLFGKARYIIYNLPMWLRPTGFNVEGGQCDNKRHLINPDNKSEIKGEIGDSIGRSGRCTRAIIDESQDLTNPAKVDASLEDVPRSRVDVGTSRGMNHFGKKIQMKKAHVCIIGWEEDPRKNPDWRTGKRNVECAWRVFVEATKEKGDIAREYDRDLMSGTDDPFIDPEWIRACIDFDLPHGDDHAAGFDIAAGGANHSIFAERYGPVVLKPHEITFKTPTEALLDAIDRGESAGISLMNYDGEGVGRAATGELKIRERPPRFRCNSILGQDRASERYIGDEGKKAYEKFRNRRAELYWNFRERCRKTYEHRNNIQFYSADEMVSLPNDPTLLMQLAQPKRVWTGSRMGVESKVEMRSRGVDSPDSADAVVLSFVDYNDCGSVVPGFDYTAGGHVGKFKIDHNCFLGEQYVAIVQTPDLTTSALCCWWWPHAVKEMKIAKPKLQVYGEIIEPNALPEDVLSQIRYRMQPGTKPIKEWIANDEMFSEYELGKKSEVSLAGLESPARLYRKMGVALKRNPLYDERGSIMLMNRMFEADMIEIHDDDCEELNNQLRVWHLRRGKTYDDNLGLALALCIFITRLRTRKQIKDEDLNDKRPYHGGARFMQQTRRAKKMAVSQYGDNMKGVPSV